jgi:hypothetical protein
MAPAFYHLQVSDSTSVSQQADTVPARQEQESNVPEGREDSALGYFTTDHAAILRIQSSVIRPAPVIAEPVPLKINARAILPPEWNFNTNFFKENSLTRTVNRAGFFKNDEQHNASAGSIRPSNIIPKARELSNMDWFLAIFLIITLLFIWIRLFYGKYFSILASAVTSFQLSAKLFREKNVLVRRVSIVLDFIYYVILSVFIFESFSHFHWYTSTMSLFNQFMLLLNIIMLFSLLRMALLRFTGFLFINRNLFSEYIHNIYVVNKSTGIILFPVVITAHYFPSQLVSLVLMIGLAILVMAFIWKSIRAYQIIIRKDVAIFYLILYLCTLEFLPLLLGYKVIISLI